MARRWRLCRDHSDSAAALAQQLQPHSTTDLPGQPRLRPLGRRRTRRTTAAAFCLLLTLPGAPSIYYGDELGLTSAWSTGGPDALLRPLLELPEAVSLAPLAHDVLAAVKQLGALRNTWAWLTSAVVTDIEVRDGVLTYAVAGPSDSLRVSINPTDRPASVVAGGYLVRHVAGADTSETATLPPRSWSIAAAT